MRVKPLSLKILFTFALTPCMAEDAQLGSWLTEFGGVYARVYETLAAESARESATTWSRGQGVQTLPTYAGVSQVAYSEDFVYIRASGLGFHVMGPWYLDGGPWNNPDGPYGTQLFGNLPSNTAILYRIPRAPVIPTAEERQATPAGATGIFADGVAMFDARDTFSYDTSAQRDQTPGTPATVVGDRVWNRFAWVTEGITFDPAQAHQAGNQYHYHASCVGPRFLMGDSVVYDAASNRYTEQFNGRHSPILGWAADGLPVYGPYGYSDPLDASSAVRRMISGYVLRDGTRGTDNLRETGRRTLPQWVVTMGLDGRTGIQLDSSAYGPDVDHSAYGETFVLGQYIEDHAYLGDLINEADGELYEEGVDFDLGLYNQRWCLTPEFPDGTWAYFMTIEEDGSPVYPLTTGRQFFAVPSGGTVNLIAEPVTIAFNAGPLSDTRVADIQIDELGGALTIDWRGVEGGTYQVERSTDLENWTVVASVSASGGGPVVRHSADLGVDTAHFYRVSLTSRAAFDETGYDLSGTGAAVEAEAFTFTFSNPLPPQGAIQSVSVGAAVGSIAAYDQTARTIAILFSLEAAGSLPLRATVTFTTPNGTVSATSTNSFTGGG